MSIKNKFVEQIGVGESDAIDLLDTNDIRVSYQVNVTGTATYTVQHSVGGDIFIDNDDNTAQTVSRDGNYIFPVQKIRVAITSGAGSVTLHVRQLVV